MRRVIYEDDVIKLLDKGWKSGVYPVASNIHALPSAQPDNDRIWEALSAVYNMDDVPDAAKSIIGDVLLGLEGEADG